MLNCNLALMQQQKALQAMDKFQQTQNQDNLNKLIRYYTQAINGAQTAQEAQAIAADLQTLLANNKNANAQNALQDVNNPLLNQNNPNQANPLNPQAPNQAPPQDKEKNKAMFKDIQQELGMKNLDKEEFEKLAATGKVKIQGKDGQAKTGKIEKGDIVTIQTAKYGAVQVQVGGDGQINGGDDKVLSVGGQAAGNNVFDGLNNINQQNPANQANPFQVGAMAGQANQNNPLQQALGADQTGQQAMFNEEEIKNLVAAILYNAIGNGGMEGA